jgi:hypothetical protein
MPLSIAERSGSFGNTGPAHGSKQTGRPKPPRSSAWISRACAWPPGPGRALPVDENRAHLLPETTGNLADALKRHSRTLAQVRRREADDDG